MRTRANIYPRDGHTNMYAHTSWSRAGGKPIGGEGQEVDDPSALSLLCRLTADQHYSVAAIRLAWTPADIGQFERYGPHPPLGRYPHAPFGSPISPPPAPRPTQHFHLQALHVSMLPTPHTARQLVVARCTCSSRALTGVCIHTESSLGASTCLVPLLAWGNSSSQRPGLPWSRRLPRPSVAL